MVVISQGKHNVNPCFNPSQISRYIFKLVSLQRKLKLSSCPIGGNEKNKIYILSSKHEGNFFC